MFFYIYHISVLDLLVSFNNIWNLFSSKVSWYSEKAQRRENQFSSLLYDLGQVVFLLRTCFLICKMKISTIPDEMRKGFEIA